MSVLCIGHNGVMSPHVTMTEGNQDIGIGHWQGPRFDLNHLEFDSDYASDLQMIN